MLGFGKSADAKPAGGDDLVFDVTDGTFMEKVVDASKTRPVIVDFWAEWCGPCKQLAPAIERAVRDAGGKVALAKMDIDRNPMVAGELRIQSIPAVYAFVGGQPVDGFMGAVPPAQIKQFIDQVVKAATQAGIGGGADIASALDAADAALAEGALPEAAQLYGAVLQAEPQEVRAIAGLSRTYLQHGDLARAEQALAMAPADKADDAHISAARAAIDLAKEAEKAAAGMAGFRAALEQDPNDHQARYDLALALVATGDKAGAVDQLLDIFKRDRTWNEEAARTQLLKLFEAFGANDPVTLSGRRKLSSMLFA